MDAAKRLISSIAQLVVGFALAAQADTIEGHHARRLDRAAVELPAMGLEQPRPADDLAAVERLDHERAATRSLNLESDGALADEEEAIGRRALTKELRAGREVLVDPASGDHIELRG